MKKELRLDREKCDLCGVCQGICPAKSINIRFQTIQAKFALNQSLCIENCRICLDNCHVNALQFEQNIKYIGGEKEWKIKTQRCHICRSPLPRVGEAICTSCRREKALIRYKIKA